MSDNTAKVSFDQTKLSFPKAIIFTIHKISIKKTNTESSICFDKATGKRVPGKKKSGNKNTNKYKLYLMALFKIDFIFNYETRPYYAAGSRNLNSLILGWRWLGLRDRSSQCLHLNPGVLKFYQRVSPGIA